jgi:Tol biopolymer transport system component
MAGSAESFPAPGSGQSIVFVSNRGQNAQDLWVTAADGSIPRRLFESSALEWHPAWSPDGTRIVYVANGGRVGRDPEILVVSADGRRRSRLTRNRVADLDPAWSPGGRRIVFVSIGGGGRGRDLYVMRADGSHRKRLVAGATCETDPAWSPDGRKILFASVCDPFSPRLYTIAPIGRGLRRLPITGSEPAWSPQGDRLAYRRTSNLLTANAGGSEEFLLTSNVDEGPAWSPDGQQIAFVRFEESDCSVYFERHIYIINRDGTGESRLFYPTCWSDFSPDWRRF